MLLIFTIVLVFFSLYHFNFARKDLTTNEHLRDKFKGKVNPFNTGLFDNLKKFMFDYNFAYSNISHFSKSYLISMPNEV